MQIFTAAHIHDGLCEECQALSGQMVLKASAGIAWPLHKFFILHIKFVHAVDYDMRMDVCAAVMPVRVRADKCLCPGKYFPVYSSPRFCACLAVRLPVCSIHGIVADNIMVRLDIIIILAFAKVAIYFHAFHIESKCVTVDAVHRLPVYFIVFKNEIPLRFTVIDIFNVNGKT